MERRSFGVSAAAIDKMLHKVALRQPQRSRRSPSSSSSSMFSGLRSHSSMLSSRAQLSASASRLRLSPNEGLMVGLVTAKAIMGSGATGDSVLC